MPHAPPATSIRRDPWRRRFLRADAPGTMVFKSAIAGAALFRARLQFVNVRTLGSCGRGGEAPCPSGPHGARWNAQDDEPGMTGEG